MYVRMAFFFFSWTKSPYNFQLFKGVHKTVKMKVPEETVIVR